MRGFTYTELYNALQTWTKDAADEYQSDLNRIIELGELKLIKDLDVTIFDVNDSTPVVTSGSRNVTKPTGCLSTNSLFLLTSGTRSRLVQRSLDWCLEYAPNVTTDTGTPTFFAELNSTTWYIVKTPTATTTLDSYFVKRPNSIVDDDSTWLGDNCGDLLFYACLASSERWLKADDRWQDIITDYQDALQKWKIENRNLLRKGDYSPLMPAAQPIK